MQIFPVILSALFGCQAAPDAFPLVAASMERGKGLNAQTSRSRALSNLFDRPMSVLGDQRLIIAGGNAQRGQVLLCSDVPERDTYIAQKTATLSSPNR